MRAIPSLLFVASFGAGIGSGLEAQTPVALTKPDAEFPEPLTSLTSVRELPGGKVIVSDRRDKIVQMFDFGSGTATPIGREGQGPGEYALPSQLFPQPGNGTLLHDLLGRRFLRIGPDGKVGDIVELPDLSGSGPGGRFMMGLGRSGGSDARGRVYFQGSPFSAGERAAGSADSIAIMRWQPASHAIDTVAWMVGPKATITSTGGGGRRGTRITIGGGKVFEPVEAWGVAADGSVARVMPSPYRVVWYPPAGGKPLAGAVVPYTPIEVTEADRKAVIEARKKRGGAEMIAVTRARGASRTTTQRADLPEPEFAETKPPFEGQQSVLVSPEGEVWVLRNQPAGATAPAYDVFDRTGTLVRKVTLNPKSRVAGFGQGAVYVVRQDEDDLEYLQRFRR